jgi:N6-adenosine-specific RNA methylase IME4/ParB-like chromosome segregation protein Spo0J
MSFPAHPLAEIFPLMPIEGAEAAELAASIKANGLHDAIVIHDGMVLDGRNRQNACEAAGVEPRYEPLPVGQEPLAFIIDKNLKRRHLNESQRAMVAARLANMPHGGARGPGEQAANLPLEPAPVAQRAAAALLNVSSRLLRSAKVVQATAADEVRRAVDQGRLAVSVAEKLAVLPVEEQRRVVEAQDPAKAARAEISRHNRNERLAEIVQSNGTATPALIAPRCSIIYADPPWRHEVWSRETGLEKSPDQHYPTMTVEEICALPVSNLVLDDGPALLFLWITVPHLMRAPEVFRAWGRVVCNDPEYGIIKEPWAYVSNYNWDKVNIGPGRWNRNQHEHLLIAKIGNMPAPSPSDRARSNYIEAATDHSAKPDYFAELIERHYPQLPKIELFRRGPPRETGKESPQPTGIQTPTRAAKPETLR